MTTCTRTAQTAASITIATTTTTTPHATTAPWPAPRRRRLLAASTAAAALAGLMAGGLPLAAQADGGSAELTVTSATLNPDGSVTLPLHQGTSRGRSVWYVLLDASDGKDAASLGINQAAKLANTRGSRATQKVSVINGVVDFPAAVDFTPDHLVVPGASGFPPAQAAPGSVGETGYSPLIEFADGRILNAPQIALGEADAVARDGSAHKLSHDKVIALDTQRRTVTLAATAGLSGGKPLTYIATDASVDLVAALEGSTWAPVLGAAPGVGNDGTDSSRAAIAVFTNGQTGATNRQRQGLSSALLDGLSPLNVTAWTPKQGRYSPLWDVHPAVWTDAAIAAGRNLRQGDYGKVAELGRNGQVVSLDGGPFRAFPLSPEGAIVNCPIVSAP